MFVSCLPAYPTSCLPGVSMLATGIASVMNNSARSDCVLVWLPTRLWHEDYCSVWLCTRPFVCLSRPAGGRMNVYTATYFPIDILYLTVREGVICCMQMARFLQNIRYILLDTQSYTNSLGCICVQFGGNRDPPPRPQLMVSINETIVHRKTQ